MANTTRSNVTHVASLLSLLVLSGCASLDFWNSDESQATQNAGELSASQRASMLSALGRNAEERGDTEDAMQTYRRALEIDDTQAEALHRLALLNDRAGDCEKAHELYLRALQHAPQVAEIHCDLAYSCYLQGRWDETEQSLRRAIALKPDFSRAHNNLGLLLGRTGRADEALREFGLAGASESQGRVNLAFAMLMSGEAALAEQQLNLATPHGREETLEQIASMRNVIRRSQADTLAAPNEALDPGYRTVSHERVLSSSE